MSLNYFIISRQKAIQAYVKKKHNRTITTYSDMVRAVYQEKNIRSLAKLLNVTGV